MNAGNAAELLAQPDVDGGLIGGASLRPLEFMEIIRAANQGPAKVKVRKAKGQDGDEGEDFEEDLEEDLDADADEDQD
jgi:hypothetical protein